MKENKNLTFLWLRYLDLCFLKYQKIKNTPLKTDFEKSLNEMIDKILLPSFKNNVNLIDWQIKIKII